MTKILLFTVIFTFFSYSHAQNKSDKIFENKIRIDNIEREIKITQTTIDSLINSYKALENRINTLENNNAILNSKNLDLNIEINVLKQQFDLKPIVVQEFTNAYTEFLFGESLSAGCEYTKTEDSFNQGKYYLQHNYHNDTAYMFINNEYLIFKFDRSVVESDGTQSYLYKNESHDYTCKIFNKKQLKDLYEWQTFLGILVLFKKEKVVFTTYIFGSCGS